MGTFKFHNVFLSRGPRRVPVTLSLSTYATGERGLTATRGGQAAGPQHSTAPLAYTSAIRPRVKPRLRQSLLRTTAPFARSIRHH